MKSGHKPQLGISLVSRQRTLDPPRIQTSNNSPARQPPILQRKRSSQCLAVKRKPVVRTQPSDQEEFKLEVRHNTLDEETLVIQEIIGGARAEAAKIELKKQCSDAETNCSNRNSRKHQLRNSSAPRLLTSPSESSGRSPSNKPESSERKPLGETFRKTFRVDINLEQVLRQHKRKARKQEPNEIQNIFAKGIRKKLLDIEKNFLIPGINPTPTFRKKLVETSLEVIKGKINSFTTKRTGKENIVVFG